MAEDRPGHCRMFNGTADLYPLPVAPLPLRCDNQKCCHIRIATIKKKRKITSERGCGEIGKLVRYWWECKMVHPLWKTVRQFLKKLKIELPYDPAILLLGIYPKELKAGPQRDICTAVLIALFTVAKRQKQAKYPLMDEWISKMSSRHTMSYYSSFKRKEIMTHAAT